MKIAIFAAGTGGHIFPALSIANEFSKEDILFFASNRDVEKKIFNQSGFNVKHLNLSGFRGKNLISKIFWVLKFPFIFLLSLIYFHQFKPDKIILMGGYISLIGYLISYTSKANLYIHEQNSVLGTANKTASTKARKVFSGFPLGLDNEIHVGNPVRNEFKNFSYSEIENKKHILVLGGSQGSSFMIDKLPEAIKLLAKEYKIIFQTGKNLHPNLKNVEFREFIDDLPKVMKEARFIICRAGALTVSEIQTLGIPAIFIPLASSVDNHQFLNAKSACLGGGGLIMEEVEFIEENAAQKILSFSKKNMNELSKNMKKDLHLDAAQRIFNEIKQN